MLLSAGKTTKDSTRSTDVFQLWQREESGRPRQAPKTEGAWDAKNGSLTPDWLDPEV